MINRWELEVGHDHGMPDPTWSEIQQALLQMDGITRSMVSLHNVGEGSLIAGGGNEEHYIVTYAPDNSQEASPTLVDPSLTGQRVALCIEGVVSEFPPWLCVGKRLMIDAFRRYFESARLPPQFVWTEWQGEFTDQYSDA